MTTSNNQIQSFLDGLQLNTPLGEDGKNLLANGLFEKLPSSDLKSLVDRVTGQMPSKDKADVAQATVSQLPDEEKANVMKQTFDALPQGAQKAVADRLTPVIGAPQNAKTIDFIWRTIVGTFSIVLLLTVLALIVGMFRDPADPAKVIVGTKPELILAIITSVIGFLAGLVSPSPVASK
jgi:hypothetical protein